MSTNDSNITLKKKKQKTIYRKKLERKRIYRRNSCTGHTNSKLMSHERNERN